MDEATQTAILALWEAIAKLNAHDMALLQNQMRMEKRMVLHEAYQASEEMQQPRIGH